MIRRFFPGILVNRFRDMIATHKSLCDAIIGPRSAKYGTRASSVAAKRSGISPINCAA